MVEVRSEVAAAEGGEVQEGVLAAVELHNYMVTFPTPKCNLCNLGDNLETSPLNSLNLIAFRIPFKRKMGWHKLLKSKIRQ